MTFPTVHMNGTGKQSLLGDLEHAHLKVREAITALANAAPNARDYYVQSMDSYYAARTEHCDRVQKLVDVRKDLEALAENISRQGR